MEETVDQLTLCVFCGSRAGEPSIYISAAESLAQQMKRNSWRLVYGGGARGIMGSLAKTLVSLSGPDSVHGIIPRALIKSERGVETPDEIQFGRTTVVSSMHERKSLMAKEADAFVAMPGGYGTLEELFEAITWNQLGIHGRPIVLFNVDGFFDELLGWIQKAVKHDFIQEDAAGIVSVANTAQEVIEKVKEYEGAPGRHNLDWDL